MAVLVMVDMVDIGVMEVVTEEAMEKATEEAMEKATEEVMEKAMEESVTRGLWDLMVDMDINRATHPAMDIAKAAMANQVTVTASPAMVTANPLTDTAATASPVTVIANPAMGTANPLMDTAATVNLVMDINASIKSNRIASVIFYILSFFNFR